MYSKMYNLLLILNTYISTHVGTLFLELYVFNREMTKNVHEVAGFIPVYKSVLIEFKQLFLSQTKMYSGYLHKNTVPYTPLTQYNVCKVYCTSEVGTRYFTVVRFRWSAI
jgi:hypothetical protein